jgi:hypothetical protein
VNDLIDKLAAVTPGILTATSHRFTTDWRVSFGIPNNARRWG